MALLLDVTDTAVPWRTLVLDTVLLLTVGFLTRSILRNPAQIDALFWHGSNRGRCR